jgi:hypothetical protein
MEPVSIVMGAPAALKALSDLKKSVGENKPLLLPYHGARSDKTLGGRSYLNVALMLRILNAGGVRAMNGRIGYRSLAWMPAGQGAQRDDTASGYLLWTERSGYPDSERDGELRTEPFGLTPDQQIWAILGFVTQDPRASGQPTLSLHAAGQGPRAFHGPTVLNLGLGLAWENRGGDAWQARVGVEIDWDGQLVQTGRNDPPVKVVFERPRDI